MIGRRAIASADFSLDDLPSTSGRLDVLLRCVRAALLVSHGLRVDTTIYLVLLGGPSAPRTVRIEGSIARYLRPDERSLAVTMRKVLATHVPPRGFAPFRAGLSLAAGGLEAVLEDLGDMTPFVLEQGAPDVRGADVGSGRPAFFLGDHLGLDAATREMLAGLGAVAVGLGPVGVHADDAIAILHNELDRRAPPVAILDVGEGADPS